MIVRSSLCTPFSLSLSVAHASVLGRRYTKPGLQAEKKARVNREYKKDIALTDCLVILCPA